MPHSLVFDIRRYSVHDGPGIRTTVFLKGCPLSCRWCHNPESQGRTPVLHYDANRCIRCGACVNACPQGALSLTEVGIRLDSSLCRDEFACVAACPAEARRVVGRSYSPAELMAEIDRDTLFFDESGGGVTFSGGEPLLQWEFLLEVLAMCGARGIHRTVDTSGFTSTEVLLHVAAQTDLVLYDLKTTDPVSHLETTGVALEPILHNLEALLASGARVRIRVPLVPGVSDGDDLERMAAWLATLPAPEGIDLLPYHASARDKHQKFGVPWLMGEEEPIPDEQVEEWADSVRNHGFQVTIGG